MEKYLIIGRVNKTLKKRWPEALVLWKQILIKASVNKTYQARLDNWIFNGSTLKFRELAEPFGEYLGSIDFRNHVNAIDTAHYMVQNRHYLKQRLFSGVFPEGVVYADKDQDESGDYKRVAFLPYSTLELEINNHCPQELLPLIKEDAQQIRAKKGEQFMISLSGQTVTLGWAIN